ncbi:MAG: response regulator [Rhodospirillaceae bacterium]
MPNRPVEIFVVDDDDAVRGSLCWLIESADYRAKGFATAEDLLAAFQPTAPGCIVTDVRMPGMSGIQLLDEILTRTRLIPVIVITAHGDIQMAVQAMKSGAFDFVEKPFEEKALLQVIERAAEESLRRHHQRDADGDLWSRLETLTPREHQVLERIVDGQSNRMVAEQLSIREKTVEAHRAHVMVKMDATSFADLVSRVVKGRITQDGGPRGPEND